jgi:hypothetical protein
VPSRRSSLRRGCAIAIPFGALLLGAVAHAQWGGTVSAESDDRYRGVSLSGSRPSARLTANYDSPDRWYAGASLARAARSSNGSYTQGTGYGGWLTPPISGRSFEFGVTASHFAGMSRDDFAEAYVGVLSEGWSSRFYYAPKYYGARVQVAYLELDSRLPLANRARLFAHLGALFPLQGASGDADVRRYDAKVGWGIVVGPWDLHVAATTVTRRGPYPAMYVGRRTALAAGASFAF